MGARHRAIILAGATASGKTASAIALLRRFPLEIISVDSAMVFRGLDIGSAKPDPRTLLEAPHHLINIRDPEQTYSAAEFARDAGRLMEEITERGAIPLLTGGTNLYFKALAGDLHALPPANAAIREEISREAATSGWPVLHQCLAAVDPQAARRIDQNDKQRIQRALEVFRISGKPISDWHSEGRRLSETENWQFLWLALMPNDRAALHQRIEHRLDDMFKGGLVDEVRNLRRRPGLWRDMPSMRSVGYRQVWHHLDGDYTLADAREKALVATRQLAKRQLTWLRNDSRYQAIEPLDKARDDRISTAVEQFLG